MAPMGGMGMPMGAPMGAPMGKRRRRWKSFLHAELLFFLHQNMTSGAVDVNCIIPKQSVRRIRG